ncbi:MAG: glutamate synthase subunit beta [Bacillota bacterium]|nr:glutamate synthase subunit beta [Bacillota bacterium]
MGKITGFLEYDRNNNESYSPKLRIKNFNEFHTPLSVSERQEQGARCMNCGVPLCQSAIKLKGMVTGCPLHNLIPEWNDCIYTGNYTHALSRLLKTSSFPEFTGRVCPALCEKACICGLNGDPVTVRENELFIIETAFAEGDMTPRPPYVRTDKQIAVIGSGPSGLAVADKLNKRGHNVTVFEKSDRIGGLLMYGIPNMKLEKHIIDRRVELMKAEGVIFITSADIGNTIPAEEILDKFDAVALCCGAKQPRDLKVINREASGVYFAVDFLTSTTKSLLDNELKEGSYISAKDKNVIIVGGGDTGNDCVGTCIRHGCKSVTQIEMLPKAPDTRSSDNPWPEWPKICKTDYGQEEYIANYGSDPRIYETTVKELISEDGKLSAVKTVEVAFKDGKLSEVEGSEKLLKADMLLIAAGFIGCENYVTNAFGVELTARNVVSSPEGTYKTNVDKVFTAGDMHRGQSLVVWAIAEGRACAKEIDEYLMGYTNME